MNISEVTWKNVKSRIKTEFEPENALEEALLWIKNNGFSFLSNGSYGAVFAKGNIVCKIWDSEDECYNKFVKFCMTRKHNPYIPKFTSIQPVGSEFNMVFTKKYKRHDMSMDFQDWISYYLDYMERGNLSSTYSEFEQQFPELSQALVDIHKFFTKNTGCGFDLHGGNFMKDNEDNIVVIDPVWDQSLHRAKETGNDGKRFQYYDIARMMDKVGIEH